MKPITFLFEITNYRLPNGKIAWKPGRFKHSFAGGHFNRIWWMWFAIAWVRMELYDYNHVIRSNTTKWVVE